MEKCFACDRPIKSAKNRKWAQIENETTCVIVGRECFNKMKAGLYWQPPKGGPRLCWIGSTG